MTAAGHSLAEKRAGHRPFQSHVSHRGRMTKGQRRALDTLWKRYGIEEQPRPDWREVFGRRAPLELEIGSGGGEAAAALAAMLPGHDHVAMEIYPPGVGSLLNKLEAENLDNVRVARADATQALSLMFADGALCRTRIFFPDPWPKKRHHKRRLINSGFVGLLAQKTAPGGIVHVATDWQEYARHIAESFSSCSRFSAVASDLSVRPSTRFAIRAERENRRVTDMVYRMGRA